MNFLRLRSNPSDLVQVVAAAITLSSLLALSVSSEPPAVQSISCDFPAVFNFGDSNSDTGGLSAAFYRLQYPSGRSFFPNPSGRYCDGRILVDFIAEKLHLPYLSAYLDSIGSNFRNGANFATSASTIQKANGKLYDSGYSPFSLKIQVTQFEQFKDRVLELYESDQDMGNLPRPEDFSKALYTIDIGQNDLDAAFKSGNDTEAVVASLPAILNLYSQLVNKLYQLGGRTFWIHNTGPVGCFPCAFEYYPSWSKEVDENGCVKSINGVVQEFNRQLKDGVSELRKQLVDAVFTYTDIYTAKYSVIAEAKKLGFGDPFKYCCGNLGKNGVPCWKKLKGSGDSCSDPKRHISWDGIHFTQAAVEIVADRILDGHLSDPPIPINVACRSQMRTWRMEWNQMQNQLMSSRMKKEKGKLRFISRRRHEI